MWLKCVVKNGCNDNHNHMACYQPVTIRCQRQNPVSQVGPWRGHNRSSAEQSEEPAQGFLDCCGLEGWGPTNGTPVQMFGKYRRRFGDRTIQSYVDDQWRSYIIVTDWTPESIVLTVVFHAGVITDSWSKVLWLEGMTTSLGIGHRIIPYTPGQLLESLAPRTQRVAQQPVDQTKQRVVWPFWHSLPLSVLLHRRI